MKKSKFNLFKETFPKFPTFFLFSYYKYLLHDCQTVLDVGCGSNSPIRFNNAYTVGFDASVSAVSSARKRKTHDELIKSNISDMSRIFKDDSFGAVVALDVIEHLEKSASKRLITQMERIAKKKVIIFTPNGFMPQDGPSSFDKHRSGWIPVEMRKLGFRVYGMYGPKILRDNYHRIRYSPEFFWALISEVFQWSFCYFHPEYAAAIICIKDK